MYLAAEFARCCRIPAVWKGWGKGSGILEGACGVRRPDAGNVNARVARDPERGRRITSTVYARANGSGSQKKSTHRQRLNSAKYLNAVHMFYRPLCTTPAMFGR